MFKQTICLLPAANRVFAERDLAVKEREEAYHERDAAFADRDKAYQERDEARTNRDKAYQERDEARAERDKATADSRLAQALCCRPIDYPRIVVETTASDEQVKQMLDLMNATWKKLGDSEPYFSVITDEKFKMNSIAGNLDAFYDTGQKAVDDLIAIAKRYDIDVRKFKDCFELGCGTGRNTLKLSGLFGHVIGSDISLGHLRMGKEAATRAGITNIDFVKFDNLGSIDALPSFDVFVSFIVLQHNPPPIAALLLDRILKKIRPNGIACFQCQTYLEGYRFSVNDYVGSHDSWEMHCLPQPAIIEILGRNGFSLLEVREDGWTATGISNTFLAQRKTTGH